jgi:hypothetical protein
LHRYLEMSAVRGEWFSDGERVQDVIRLLRDPEGLAAWRSICEALGWRQPQYKPRAKRKRRDSRFFDPKPLISPEEKRRKEREEWWQSNEHSLSQRQGSA